MGLCVESPVDLSRQLFMFLTLLLVVALETTVKRVACQSNRTAWSPKQPEGLTRPQRHPARPAIGSPLWKASELDPRLNSDDWLARATGLVKRMEQVDRRLDHNPCCQVWATMRGKGKDPDDGQEATLQELKLNLVLEAPFSLVKPLPRMGVGWSEQFEVVIALPMKTLTHPHGPRCPQDHGMTLL